MKKNTPLNRQQLITLLQQLDEKLKSNNLQAQLFIVGGAAMALEYNHSRVTQDIDALFEPKTELYALAIEVAAENGISDDWLNDGAKGFLPGNDANAKQVFASENLVISVASPEYMLAMKLHSGRGEKDYADAAQLGYMTGNISEHYLSNVLRRYYPERLLNAKHMYICKDVAELISKRIGRPASTDILKQPKINP